MSGRVMVRADGVSKKFCRSLKRSLWYGVKDLAAEMALRSGARDLRAQEFWALEDVSFEVREGESLGVIGPNGAGKTTLLKLLNGLIRPDRGSLAMGGKAGALISLGAGFNPVLTGKENIYIYAAVLGIPKSVVDSRLEEIIDFADIGAFIDAPVRSYSAGMKVRLGFSVAVNMEPEVLVIDEVLAVGDMAFARKSRKRMNEFLNSGVTMVMVSHNIRQVEALCENAIFLNNGRIEAYGPTTSVTDKYYEFTNRLGSSLGSAESGSPKARGEHANRGEFEVVDVQLLDAGGQPAEQFRMGETLTIRTYYDARVMQRELQAAIAIQTVDGIYVSFFSTQGLNDHPDVIGPGHLDCVIRDLPLREGPYTIFLTLSDRGGKLFRSYRVADLLVLPDTSRYAAAGASGGLVHIPVKWNYETAPARSSSKHGALGDGPKQISAETP